MATAKLLQRKVLLVILVSKKLSCQSEIPREDVFRETSHVKGSIHALVRALANDLGGTGITVNAVAPTVVKTEGLVARTPVGGPFADELMKLVVSQQTIKRESTPVDAANALSFLVSEDADLITGQILHGTAASVEAGHRIRVVVDATCLCCRWVVPTYEHGNIPSFVIRSKNEDHSLLGHCAWPDGRHRCRGKLAGQGVPG